MILNNNASGGVDGVAVTTPNSGGFSGRALESIVLGTGATATFSSAKARGNLAYKLTTTGTAAPVYLGWYVSIPPVTTAYARFYLLLPTIPSTSIRIFRFTSASSQVWMTVGVSTTGKLTVRDTIGNLMFTTVSSIPTNKWIRLEIKCVSHASAGQAEMYVYHDADSTHHVEKQTSAASFNTFGGQLYGVDFGNPAFPIANYTFYMVDLGFSDQGYMGPVPPTQYYDGTLLNTGEGGTDGVSADYLNTGSYSGNYINKGNSGSSDITFSNAQAAHGTYSYAIQTTASTDVTRFAWLLSGVSTFAAARMYVFLPSIPSSPTLFLSAYSAGSRISGLGIDTNGNVYLQDAVGTTVWTSSVAVAANTWVRLELVTGVGTTTGNGTLKAAFYALDSVSALEAFSINTANTGVANADTHYFGKVNFNAWTGTFYIDDLAMQDNSSNLIGPYTSPGLQSTYENTFEGGTNGTTITKANSGGVSGAAFNTYAANTSSITFSNTQAMHRNMSMYIYSDSTTSIQVGYKFADTSVVAFRAYYYFANHSSTNDTTLVGVRNVSTYASRIITNATNRFEIKDAGGSIIATSTNPVPSNTWIRVELVTWVGTTTSNGRVKFAYYLGDSTTPEYLYDPGAVLNTGIIPIVNTRLGKQNNTGSFDGYIDSISVSLQHSNFIGPFSPSSPPPSYTVIPPLGWGHQL